MKNSVYFIALFLIFSKAQAQTATGFVGAQVVFSKQVSSPSVFAYGKYYIDEEAKDLGFWTLAVGTMSLDFRTLMNDQGGMQNSIQTNPTLEAYTGSSYAFKLGRIKNIVLEFGAGSRIEVQGNQFQNFLGYVSVTKESKHALGAKKFQAMFAMTSDGRYVGSMQRSIGKKLSLGIQMQSDAWGTGVWYNYKQLSFWAMPSYAPYYQTFGGLAGLAVKF